VTRFSYCMETIIQAGNKRMKIASVPIVLRRRDLRRADLRSALLISADLSRVDLADADLLGADLRDAAVAGADLTRALFLGQAQVNAMRGDASTRLPDGLARPAHWR
ncbi:pentapeptide repeat-containing protein, partial [Nocardioides sp. NPDC000441]|uniref:pentapeptide repeat-containing protein n=1 Tax=Nocardioides sp. NPDC000441 TaxID=3154256 RepID=UPI00331A1574